MGRAQSVTLLVAVIVVSAVAWWWPSTPTPAVPSSVTHSDPTTSETGTPSVVTILVHVSGAVARPGVVTLPEGSRVIDAVTAAGGVVDGGAPGAVNLAAPVADGEQVRIPWVDDPAAPVSGDERVVVNTASLTELETLPGVGPVTAQRIIDHREANGPFGVVEDLLDVPGIGEATLARLRPLVRIP